MVDALNGGSTNVPADITPVDTQTPVDGTPSATQTQPLDPNVVIDSILDGDQVDLSGLHIIDSPEIEGDIAQMVHEDFGDLSGPKFDAVADIYALIFNIIMAAQSQQNKNAVDAAMAQTESLFNQKDISTKLAELMEQDAYDKGLAQALGGGFQAAGGAAGGLLNSRGLTATAQSSQGLATGIQGAADADLQYDLQTTQGDQQVAGGVVASNGKLVETFDQGFGKAASALDATLQSQQRGFMDSAVPKS